MRATGGLACGPTTTKSSSRSSALAKALAVSMSPMATPSLSIKKTRAERIRSLIGRLAVAIWALYDKSRVSLAKIRGTSQGIYSTVPFPTIRRSNFS